MVENMKMPLLFCAVFVFVCDFIQPRNNAWLRLNFDNALELTYYL